jgi:hypothetical protein
MDGQTAEPYEPFVFGLNIAGLLVSLPEPQWMEVFEELRRTKELSKAIGEINQLLSDPVHRDLAVSALRRVGLYHMA